MEKIPSEMKISVFAARERLSNNITDGGVP